MLLPQICLLYGDSKAALTAREFTANFSDSSKNQPSPIVEEDFDRALNEKPICSDLIYVIIEQFLQVAMPRNLLSINLLTILLTEPDPHFKLMALLLNIFSLYKRSSHTSNSEGGTSPIPN
jgi:hypothetical protein